jgi:hypothetical protein
MDKIERYTQHHTATPDLAQEAIARISMTNDKDSEVLAELLGTMRERCTDPCRSEKAELGCDCDAARRAAVMLRQPTQSDALRGALEGVLPYVLTNYFRCNGDKCRHPTCASCFGEDFAESQSDKANLALTKAKAALAALQEQSK